MSRGASGEAAGRLVEEKVGVTAGIVTIAAPITLQAYQRDGLLSNSHALGTHTL